MTPGRLLAGAALVSLVAETLAHGNVLIAAAVTAFGVGAGALFTYLALARVDASARPILALLYGVTAVFTAVAFWSALPFGFGAAALATSPRRLSLATGLGAFGLLLALVFCIVA